jgi:hypothetical protein
MCQFFSCISNGKGKIRYFNADIRRQIRDGKLSYSEDSHDSLCSYFKTEIPLDVANKYEYDPTTGEFTIDQINAKDDEGFPLDDTNQVEAFCRKLDFNEVVPNWSYIADVLKRLKTYKPKNPITATKMPDEQIMRGVLVRIKDSVWNSVRDSVRDSVWASVRDSVWNSVWDSVWDSAWDSVRASVGDSVRNSVWNSVRDSVWDSVWDSVRNSVWGQSAICGYHAINKFLKLGIEHPAFDLVELGVIVVQTGGMVKVYGKKGKFLGEFRE